MTANDDPRCFFHPASRDHKFTHAAPKDGSAIKRIIIACDGTWQNSSQDSDEDESNVTRLCRALETSSRRSTVEGETEQVVYYQGGVGTGISAFERVIGGSVGWGLQENVRDAYIFLSNNYESGDEIFIFGFSRGAYTARSLAGFINQFGILHKSEMHHFSEVYEQYKIPDPDSDKPLFKKYLVEKGHRYAKHMNVPIKCVGVWDTVGSLGIPEYIGLLGSVRNRKYKFHDTNLSIGIENAFHALALDETRKPFDATLWRLPRPMTRPAPPPNSVRKYPDDAEGSAPQGQAFRRADPAAMRDAAKCAAKPPVLRQCWFPGVHTDVGGGGTKRAEPFAELSNLTLMWMVDQTKHLLRYSQPALMAFRGARGVWAEPAAAKWRTAPVKARHGLENVLWTILGQDARTPGALPCALGEQTVHPVVRMRWEAGCRAYALHQRGAAYDPTQHSWTIKPPVPSAFERIKSWVWAPEASASQGDLQAAAPLPEYTVAGDLAHSAEKLLFSAQEWELMHGSGRGLDVECPCFLPTGRLGHDCTCTRGNGSDGTEICHCIACHKANTLWVASEYTL
ncbi:hypothetical protein DFH27DRAFT_652186 [Peziza echinospora]|nr:hypothetical protein DFH27DRAFT_652186 [Peziza echinospora]